MTPRMSRKGNGWDNACLAAWHRLLKKAVYLSPCRTRAEARVARFEYIEVFDNRQRLHSARDYRTPQEAAVTARTA
jgi:transposase InsO family protein